MTHQNSIPKKLYGNGAPTWKDLLMVIMVVLLLIALDWIVWFKFGWLH